MNVSRQDDAGQELACISPNAQGTSNFLGNTVIESEKIFPKTQKTFLKSRISLRSPNPPKIVLKQKSCTQILFTKNIHQYVWCGSGFKII